MRPQNPPALPLVSILIYNYNYGRYLRECFDSALNQSYSNIEILFSDNASTDDSWQIANDYNSRYPGKLFLARNRKNYGATDNLNNCIEKIRGKYYLMLCSDDKIHPDYVKHAIELLESNPEAALAIVNRYILDQSGNAIEETPFYNQTCKIPPPLQAAVYMMASVNPSLTQVVYRSDCCHVKGDTSGMISRYHGTRMLDFNLSCEYAILYIKEPLVYHRMHDSNDSSSAIDQLMEVIGPYTLNIEFVEIARSYGYTEVLERWQPSVEKLSKLSLRYSIDLLIKKNERLAKQYFYLALALLPEIEEDEGFEKLSLYWRDASSRQDLIQEFTKGNKGLVRSTAYDPPPGSIPLSAGNQVLVVDCYHEQ